MYKQVPPIDSAAAAPAADPSKTEAASEPSPTKKSFKFAENEPASNKANSANSDILNTSANGSLEPRPPAQPPSQTTRRTTLLPNNGPSDRPSQAQRALKKAEEAKAAELEQHLQEHKQLQGHHSHLSHHPVSHRTSLAKIKERQSFTAAVVPDPTPKAQQELNIKKLFTVFADLKTGLVNRDEFVLAVQETGLMIDKDPRLKSLSAMKQTGPANLDLGTFSQFVIYWSRMT